MMKIEGIILNHYTYPNTMRKNIRTPDIPEEMISQVMSKAMKNHTSTCQIANGSII